MSINVTPHVNFRGNAREALNFYQSVFGGDLIIVSYADMGNEDQQTAQHVSWGQVESNAGFRLMAYDAYPHLNWDRGQDSFFVSVRGTDESELQDYWGKLVEGAEVRQPLSPAPWAPLYGQLKDKFGVTWVLDIAVEYPVS